MVRTFAAQSTPIWDCATFRTTDFDVCFDMRFWLLIASLMLAACPDNPGPPPPPECGNGPDRDGDGVIDDCDNCPDGENPDQSDADHDGAGDLCDFDDDNDGIADDEDSCPWVLQGEDDPPDTDGDGLGDVCDDCPMGEDEVDSDGDGFHDCEDHCPNLASDDNEDSDGDGVGDTCDNCPEAPNAGQVDRDGDGIGDACDDDQPFDIVETTLSEIHERIEDGELTCTEVVEAYLARVNQYDLDISDGPPHNAFVMLNENVRDDAADLDAAFADSGELSGPLHCAVFVVKTNFGTTDTDATNGSLAALGVRVTDDAFAVGKMRDAGGILLGSTGMDEFARGIHGIGGAHGKSGNAYLSNNNSGGSSGGSGVAVGANFALGGTGTDNCASLTIPASYNGLVTMRSTLGLVSTDNIFPSGKLDAVPGPMARTVTDMVRMLDVMAQLQDGDDSQPGTWKRPDSFLDALDKDGLEGKRVGVLRKLADDTSDTYRLPFGGGDAYTQRVWRRTFDTIERLGGTIVDNVTLPEFDERRYGGGVVVATDAFLDAADGPLDDFDDLCDTNMFSKHVWDDADQCKSRVRNGRLDPEGSLQFGATQYAKNREHITETMDALDLDVLVFPVDAFGAPNVTASKANCIQTSVTGMPAMTLIVGYETSPVLPIGLMIMGRQWDEATLIEVGYALEQGTMQRRPPVMASAVPAEDVPLLDLTEFNALSLDVAVRAFENVLRDGGKFELNGAAMETATRQVLEERGVTHLHNP